MVLDIVKTAVHIKMRCNTRNDLISPAEVAYGTAYAMSFLGMGEDMKEKLLQAATVTEILELVLPVAKEKMDKLKDEDKEHYTLLFMITECKLEGEITDEVRELVRMGWDAA